MENYEKLKWVYKLINVIYVFIKCHYHDCKVQKLVTAAMAIEIHYISNINETLVFCDSINFLLKCQEKLGTDI